MSRRELYRAAKGAFSHLYLYLLATAAFGLMRGFQKSPELTAALMFVLVSLTVSLWTKRTVILDLISGRTSVFRGEIARREIASSSHFRRIEYLVEKTDALPRKFILFSDRFPLSPEMLSRPVAFRYLPRSLIVVKLEQIEPPHPGEAPRHRTKAWYREKERNEQEQQAKMQLKWCKFHEYFWFWEELPVLILAVLSGVFLICRVLRVLLLS